MNKESKKQIRKYCSDVGKELTCSSGIKRVFISELKSRIYDFCEERSEDELTRDRLEEHFGLPKEIAQSFFSENDLTRLKKREKKNTIFLVLIAVVLLLVLSFITYFIIEVIRNSTHSITTTVTPKDISIYSATSKIELYGDDRIIRSIAGILKFQ